MIKKEYESKLKIFLYQKNIRTIRTFAPYFTL